MRASLKTFLLVVFVAFFATSCSLGQRQPLLDVTVRNNTTNRLGWAELNWGEGSITVGIFPAGKGATFFDASLPKSTRTHTATIEFVNEDDPRLQAASADERVSLKRRLIQKVPVDVSALQQLAPGHYHVTFSLLSLTNAELVIGSRQKIP